MPHVRTHERCGTVGGLLCWNGRCGIYGIASLQEVAALTGVVPSGFAYPHGAHDHALAALVAEAGYRWAVTTRQDTIARDLPDRYALPRLGVGDWSGRELVRKIAWRGG